MATLVRRCLPDSRWLLVALAIAATTAILAVAASWLPALELLGLLYLAGLLGTVAFVWRFRQLEHRSAASIQQLADLKRAIDYAAIVATTDVTGRITYVNDRFCEISQYGREELLGQDHRIVNSGYHPPAFMRDLWRTIASGRVWHGEIRNRAKDGSHYWVNTTIVPFLNADGKPYQYIAIRADITARKAAEHRLTQQAALARVGQMAAVVAHEVRNPLAGIKGAIQILMSRRPTEHAELQVMRGVVDRIDALGDLINDLIAFARPRASNPTACALRPLLAEAVLMLQRDPIGVSVEVAIEGPDISLVADAELVRAAVLNLLLNAAQAMHGHGRVALSTVERQELAMLHVHDTGPGIPPELREQVFEPFFTTKSRGGGLGLAIARRTAELHGGSLTLSCPESGGAQFTLTLPLSPREPAMAPM
jgi:PAS domain S-box-containing protein